VKVAEPNAEAEGAVSAAPPLAASIAALEDLAFDLRWTWMHQSDELWRRVDPIRWEQTRNPWLVLQCAGRARLEALAGDAEFRSVLETALRERERAASSRPWFATAHPNAQLGAVAYFCMEFGLTAAIPIYAGGLGVLAGDHLKAASELGVPVIGVGLLYYGGYFRQVLDDDGTQRELYPPVDPAWLPLRRVLDRHGAWLSVPLALPGRSVTLRAWEARIGHVALYLLDANDPANAPEDRRITAELYGGGPDVRLRQELALGVGGWRVLRALGLRPDVCHCNEGHAAFAMIERAHGVAADRTWPFDRALAATRPGNVFTTHTAVMAGFDRFDRSLIEPYLDAYAAQTGLDASYLWSLGHERGSQTFNMAHLAIRTSGRVNGVSRLHGDVSRHLFSREFPRWPSAEIPVGHVTNGVHMPSWESLLGSAVRTRGVEGVSDAELWRLRCENRARLVATVRRRGHDAFDAQTLTIGWARRFAAYKRPTLMLHDAALLCALLSDPQRPIQIVVAGKAHPRDADGKALLADWVTFARLPEACGRVAVLADYDMELARQIVQGVDLWLNTPRRPWEASGTSGMKVVPSGGLNLSENDGWWSEARSDDAGWTLTAHGDDEEAEELYALLRDRVVPAFYNLGDDGLPHVWLARVRASMARLTQRFSADRMVREYVERCYLPAAAHAQRRLAGDGEVADSVVSWAREIDELWHDVRFERVGYEHVAGGLRVEAVVHLGALSPGAVRAQLFAHPVHGEAPEVVELGEGLPADATPGTYIYETRLQTMWPTEHYTARVIPYHADAAVPLEQANILWER
jgi:glycogen phosphorylase